MEKRIILAIALSMGLLLVWQSMFAPPKKQETTKSIKSEIVKEEIIETKLENNLILDSKIDDNLTNETIYTLKNSSLVLEFSSLGASIKQITIINKDIKEAINVDFFSSKDKQAMVFELIKNINFKDISKDETSITFNYLKEDKSINISYSIDNKNPYLINVNVKSNFNTDLKYLVSLYQDQNLKEAAYGLSKDPLQRIREYVYFDNAKTERASLLEYKEGTSIILNNTVSWFGIADKYFTVSVLNKDNIFKTSIDKKDSFIFTFSTNKNNFSFDIFAGPKDVRYLRPIDKTLSNIIDFGWLSFLSVPLLELLKFLYSIIPNYGIAIILLTLIVRLVLYPLQHKSMKSMKRMQVLQPQIKALQEKFKNDKERMNKEVMQFMRTHKLNPMGGCFPMLLQLPVFFALYKVLGNAVELYQAPFILWITDLAIKDPYYVLPALMGVMMFFQQKLTPNPSMDPMQAKIMLYMMPIVITVFMVNLPSGLTLYIMFSSMLGILQQYFINKSKV